MRSNRFLDGFKIIYQKGFFLSEIFHMYFGWTRTEKHPQNNYLKHLNIIKHNIKLLNIIKYIKYYFIFVIFDT